MYRFEQLVIESIKKGTFNNGYTARRIWLENGLNKYLSIESFQRAVTKVIEAYQETQLIKARQGLPYDIVLSSPTGYYISQTVEDAQNGFDFYCSRIEPLFKRKHLLRVLIANKYKYDPQKRININAQLEIPFETIEPEVIEN